MSGDGSSETGGLAPGRMVAFVVSAEEGKLSQAIISTLTQPEIQARLGPVDLAYQVRDGGFGGRVDLLPGDVLVEDPTEIAPKPAVCPPDTIEELARGLWVGEALVKDLQSDVLARVEVGVLDAAMCYHLSAPGSDQRESWRLVYEARLGMSARFHRALGESRVAVEHLQTHQFQSGFGGLGGGLGGPGGAGGPGGPGGPGDPRLGY